jgi:hypothetical protein
MSRLRLIPYAVLTAGGLLAASGGANAQSMYEINRIQDQQQNRIERGINSGQITRSEAARLEQGERAIDRAQRRAEADGHVSSQERARIDRMVERENRDIYRQSHDRQQAWDRGQQWGHTDGRANNGWRDHDGWGRRDGGSNWSHDGQQGFQHRDADRRDWGRDHNNGSWNQGRDHNGWNRGDNTASNGGWNHNGGSTNSGGWNHNGGNTGGGTTGGTTGGTPTGSTHNWNGGNWNRGGSTGTGTHTPPTGGTAVANNGGTRNWGNWGGQTRQVSAPAAVTPTQPTRTYTASNTGARSAGGSHSFGGHR